MNASHWIEVALLISIISIAGIALAHHMNAVFSGHRHTLSLALGAIEDLIYRLCRIDPDEQTDWKQYALSLLSFSATTCVLTYLFLRFQLHLPLNPQAFDAPSPDLALSATIGYNTNASWQSFSGESVMSYFSQMGPLLFQFFASPAIGMAVAVALIRGVVRNETPLIGNFWVDLVRSVLYVLLPLSLVFAIFLMSQGVIQNFLPYVEATTLEGVKQLIAQGPAAAQVSVKLIGTNGGGFFNANSAHPYENPTALCNFVQIVMMLIIPAAFPFYLGLATKNTRHGRAVWIAMALMLVMGILFCQTFEQRGNPLIAALGGSDSANWTGKESRFGIFGSSTFAVVTTATGTGAVNSMLDSFTPLGGMTALASTRQ